jgi:hypothetical protein
VFTGFLWGFMKERGYFEDTGLGGKTILKWNFKK